MSHRQQRQQTDKSVSNLNDRLARLWPDDDKKDDGINYWKGKPIIPVKEWRRLSISDSLQFFPDYLVVIALLPEGHSVDPYDKSIYPYADGDPVKGTEEWKRSYDSWVGPQRKLSTDEFELWQTRLKEARAKARKEDPFEIWVQEYKELLKFKKIELPKHDGPKIV